jgi:CDP-diacylglycerol--serine O-phosphatidyltransferase
MDQGPQLIKGAGANEPIKLRPNRRELVIFILPNLFTTANLFAGYYSIVAAIRGQWTAAAIAIAIAAFLDGIDGRVARLTKTQSAFGEQYDSMSDLLSFGAAPAILIHQWALTPYGKMGWIASFVYLTCAALRLTRFNVFKQNVEKRYFQGCPSPIAACSVASAVLFYQEMAFVANKSIYMLAVMIVLGLLMVSQIRYRSFKDLHFASQKQFAGLLLLITILVVVATNAELFLFPLFCLYLVSAPVAELSRILRRRYAWYPGTGRS